MNRILHRPTPLALKSKLVQETHQFDKHQQQKRKQQTSKNNMHKTSQENKIIKKQKQAKNQLNSSKDHSIAESIEVIQTTGIQNKNQYQPSKTDLFQLVQVPYPSHNSIRSNVKQSSFIISSKNQLQYSMVQSQSVSSKSSLELLSDPKINFNNTQVKSFNNLPIDQPHQQLQSRVIEAINIKNSTNNCYESSTRLNQFHNTLYQSHNSNKQQDKSLFDIIFQNVSSDLKTNSNVNEQPISDQKINYDLTTQKKKPSQQERQTPPSTLPINNRLSEFQSPKNCSKKKNNLRSVSRCLSNMKEETPAPKIVVNQKKKDTQSKQKASILTLVAGLSKNNTSEQIETLRNRMVNQKNLKLRDYLRLASLSNDARFDNYKKQSRNMKSSSVNHMQVPKNSCVIKKSSLFNKQKSIIDPSKSISLIKKSLKKKLQKSIEMALKIFEEIESQKQIVDKQYDDLVFICNIHRLFDENIFQTAELLQDLFQEYKSKRKFNSVLESKEELTKQAVIQLLSPRKKKNNQQNVMSIFQQLLLGLKIIKRQQLRQA